MYDTSDIRKGLKVLIDGGLNNSLVAVLQVNGASATTLQTGYDTAPSAR